MKVQVKLIKVEVVQGALFKVEGSHRDAYSQIYYDYVRVKILKDEVEQGILTKAGSLLLSILTWLVYTPKLSSHKQEEANRTEPHPLSQLFLVLWILF
jgi:hypothetical protein